MVLADTSIWVDHLRRGNAALASLLEHGRVAMHPFIVGEVACGNLSERSEILGLMQQLPAVVVADPAEILAFIEHHELFGKGIEYVDVHLLASTALTHGAAIWTLDKRLRALADRMKLAASLMH